MASGRIKGITIEINGDTTGLQNALSKVDKSLKNTNTALKDVNRLLKLDPGNVDLLQQKQGYLSKAIQDVKEKLDMEKRALEQLKGADQTEETTEQQKALEREIIATEQALKSYEDEWNQTEEALKNADRATDDAADSARELAQETEKAGDASEDATGGWTMGKQALVDLAEKGAELAIRAIKKLAEAMKDAVIDSAAFADEIVTMSTVTGLSTDTLQEFEYMTGLLDVSVDTITGSLTKLTNNMQTAASGTGSAAEAFAALGVEVTGSDGHLRNAEDVFYDVIDALGEMENSTERDAYSMDLFGRSAQDLNPMIEAGSDAVAAFAAEAHDMGYVLDSDALGALVDLQDSMDRASNAMDTVKRQIAVALAPVVEQITEAFVEWAQSVDWEAVGEKIGAVMQKISEVVGWIVGHKEIVIAVIVAITASVVALTVAMTALAISMAPISAPILLITGLVAGLIAVFVALEVKFHAFSNFFKETWEELKAVIGPIVEAIKGFFTDAADKISEVWGAIVGFFQGVWQGIQNVFATVRNFFVERFMSSVQMVQAVWSGIVGFFSGLWAGIQGVFSNVAGFFSTVFNGALSVVHTIINAIVGVIKMPINGVISLINVFIRGLNRIRIPSWVPLVGGRGINIPTLNYLARGGVLEKGQVGILEGSGAEAVVPLENNEKWIRAVADDMTNALHGAGMTLNITVNGAPGQNPREIADAVMYEIQHAVNRKGAVFG